VGRPADLLRLVRAPLALTAAGDVVACAALARGPGWGRGAPPLTWGEAGALAATALLVYAAGMAGNDLADRSRDRTIHPERPLPSGRLGVTTALAVVLGAAAGAVALGGGPAGHAGAVLLALGLAALYDTWLKRFVTGGALAMGGVRAANASVGVLPLLAAGTTSPWVLAAPLCVGLCSAGITVLSTAEGRPAVETRRRLVARGAAAIAYGGAALLAWIGADSPVFGAFLGVGIVTSVLFGRVPRRGPVKAQVFEMLLGLFWLDAVLAAGARPGHDWVFTLGTLSAAFAAVIAAQLFARALRRGVSAAA
jgi:4-hydroxybenzoate polyprenyltransferase